VPEFNLQDWRSEPSVVVPTSSTASVDGWIGSADGERRRHDGARRRHESRSQQQMAAAQALARGDQAGARSRLEAARDALCGLMTAHSPRCPAVVQDELRGRGGAHPLPAW
jgi:hypothetical protein